MPSLYFVLQYHRRYDTTHQKIHRCSGFIFKKICKCCSGCLWLFILHIIISLFPVPSSLILKCSKFHSRKGSSQNNEAENYYFLKRPSRLLCNLGIQDSNHGLFISSFSGAEVVDGISKVVGQALQWSLSGNHGHTGKD